MGGGDFNTGGFGRVLVGSRMVAPVDICFTRATQKVTTDQMEKMTSWLMWLLPLDFFKIVFL